MKYTVNNPPLKCFMRQSTWYKGAPIITTIRGVLVHSTGANNTSLKRYIQPDDNAVDKQEMLNLLGVNSNKNDWNHITRDAGVNAWIGKLANGEVTTIQTGEWDRKPWGCGSGKKGSCNNGWIQYEICEDSLTDKNYFDKVYQEAVELTAYLCTMYNLNPMGTVSYSGVTVPVILCHQDSYKLGLGSGHADVLHWFPKFGKSMDDFRNDVAIKMKGEDDEMLSYEQWKVYMEQYRNELAAQPNPEWSKQSGEWDKAVSDKIVSDSRPCDFATRLDVASMVVRAKNNSI